MAETRLGLVRVTSTNLSFGVIAVENQISPGGDYNRLNELGSITQLNSLKLLTLPYGWREAGKGSLMVRGYARRMIWGGEKVVFILGEEWAVKFMYCSCRVLSLSLGMMMPNLRRTFYV